MKKVISLLLVCIFAISIFAGCGAQKAAPDTAQTDTTKQEPAKEDAKKDAPAEKAKLKMWYYYGDKGQQETMNALMKEYSDQSKVAEIKAEVIPFADFKKQLSVGLAATNLPDLVLIDNPDNASYAAMGLFADLTAKLADWTDKDQYFEGPWKSAQLDGKTYGIPFGSNCLGLFYNKDMFEKAGVKEPPQTWDELRETAKKLTGNGVTGIGIAAPKSEEGTFQFLPWILAAGGEQTKLDSPEGVKAYSYLADLIKDGSMSKEVINWTQGDLPEQFKAKKIAMMIMGPWQLEPIKRDAPDLKFGVAMIPKDKQFSSVLGGENWGVVNGKNVDATLDFVKWVTAPEKVKSYISKFGYFPSRKDVAADPQFTATDDLKVFMQIMEVAQPRGPHAKWPQVSTGMFTALQESLTLSKTPEAAAKDGQALIDKALK